MDIETQDELYRQVLAQHEDLKHAYSQETLVELLREIQDIYGCIPSDLQEDIASEFNIKISVISSIIKIYPSLLSMPKRHKITVCMGRQCSSRESQLIMDAIHTELAVRRNSTVLANHFSLTTQNCLKQCKTAPNIKIDNDIYYSVKPDEVSNILAGYR